jgi:hypothetical protein
VGGIVLLGAAAGAWTAGLLDVVVTDKELSGLEWSEELRSLADTPPTDASVAPAVPMAPLQLRLVDAGGVGIPADSAAWGSTYSHATYVFDQLVVEGEPWLDPAGVAKVREDWRRYIARMREYGNNGVVVDAFLQLVDFDGVGTGDEILPSDDPRRGGHRAFRAMFDGLVRDASALDMHVYLKTDLPVVTSALERHLSTRGVGPGDAAFWEIYAAAFDEIFTELPEIDGAVIRVGEGGPLFNRDGGEYASYVGVRQAEELQLMLRTLLPVFEHRERTLIFRSWSVGVGPLGDLHNDPEVYRIALDEIDSPALVVSTKFVQGDYFGFLPLNPTLLGGRHRRLVEMQARREYEGFGALANYLGHAHAEAMRTLTAVNPHIVGTFLWTQEGGPLRAGPLSLYEVAGFWTWTDANVFATSRLAIDPTADPRALASDWVRLRFGDDPEVVTGLTDVLLDSREALEKALYVRPYATRRVEIVGVEAPPILQVFEWDVLSGWSSVLSTLYRAVADDVATPIAEGYEALRITEEMRATLGQLAPRIGDHPDYEGLARSLEYQSSLYRVLAEFRATFLLYYGWLDHGGDPAPWRDALARFDAAAEAHQITYAADLDFPAFDLAPARAAARRASEAGADRMLGRLWAVLLVVLVVFFQVWGRDGRTRAWTSLVAVIVATSLLVEGPVVVPLGVAALLVGYTLALAWSWHRPSLAGAGIFRAAGALASVPYAALLVLVVIGFRGPDHFWLLFWTQDLFRGALFAALSAVATMVLVASWREGYRLSGQAAHATGSVLIATGFALFVITLVLPDIEGTLAALDDPLQLLPMRPAIINGVTHYAGVSDFALRVPAIVGGALVALGAGFQKVSRRRRAPGPGPTVPPRIVAKSLHSYRRAVRNRRVALSRTDTR